MDIIAVLGVGGLGLFVAVIASIIN